MRTDPGFHQDSILNSLHADFGIRVTSLKFLPLGLDAAAAVYRATGDDGRSWFVKVKAGPAPGPGPSIARELNRIGIEPVLAPIPTRSGEIWTRSADKFMLVFPYRDGTTAVETSMSRTQWHVFGQALRAVHDARLDDQLTASVPVESFAIPSADDLVSMLDSLETTPDLTENGQWFHQFGKRNRPAIDAMIRRTRELQTALAGSNLPRVLCHADIHAANILVGFDGAIHLADWDAPRLAPRERDLLFVIGSRIARDVLPHEERWFFEGYGPTEINLDALVLFRYERVIEDLVEFGKQLLTTSDPVDPDAQTAQRLLDSFFAPGGMLEDIDIVVTPPGVSIR